MRVVITDAAKLDLQAAHDWWASNRSSEQALRWYSEVRHRIAALSSSYTQYGLAPESSLVAAELRQMPYGLGVRATHRVLYVVDRDEIVVLRIRHVSQRSLTVDDLRR